jgi:hypothetical protein
MRRIRGHLTMANIKIDIEPENGITIFTVEGDLTADEILDYSLRFYDKNPTRLVLWDATRGTLNKVTGSDLRDIANAMKEHTRKREGGKTALVGQHGLNFGIARMYAVYAEIEGLAVSYRAFRDTGEAMKWLYS